MIAPINDEILNVVPVTHSAASAPKLHSSVAARMAMGCEKVWN
jgi:hypothetical protein